MLLRVLEILEQPSLNFLKRNGVLKWLN